MTGSNQPRVWPTPRGRERISKGITREQARRVDRVCIEEFGIPGIVLMENAARSVHLAALSMIVSSSRRPILIVCGGGNNGGDGYAAARHLHNAGYEVVIAASKGIDELEGDAATNAYIASKVGLRIEPATPRLLRNEPADLVIDALFGTGLSQPPHAGSAGLIRTMNQRGTPVLAVDIPSGLDCDTGRPLGAPQDCVRAAVTVTLVAPKIGFEHAGEYTGRVIVGDIGAPPEAIESALRQ